MADEKNNALAELAERITQIFPEGATRGTWVLREKDITVIRKAQRIVAELAEVKSQPGGTLFWADSAQALRKCRAIAEEGDVA